MEIQKSYRGVKTDRSPSQGRRLKPVNRNSEFLTRVGIPLRGLRKIGEYMNVSAMTILRWHKCFRGNREPRLCFPLMMAPSGKGWGWSYQSHTALIADWVRRWSEIDAQGHPSRPRRAYKPKPLRIGVTAAVCGVSENPNALREGLPNPANHCTCGTMTLSTAHLNKWKST